MTDGIGKWKPGPGEDPFDILFTHDALMVHSINKDGVLIKVSRRWAETLGYTPDEMIGRKSVDFLTEPSRIRARDVKIPKLMREGDVGVQPYDFVRRDGSILPVLLTAVALRDDQGGFVRSLALIFDNSAAKEAERALAAKAAEAEEANTTKSRFLASMSHEIRTPMNAILGFAHLLQWSNLSTRDAQKVEAIISAGDTLMDLLTDLLDLSRIEAHKMRIEAEPFGLHRLLYDIRDWWTSSAREKGLEFHLSVARDVPDRVISDDGRIRQILNNYLSNAIKFTASGSITVSASVKGVEDAPEPAGESSDTPPRTILCFEVEDTGVGLSEQQIAKLFRPFVQADTGFSGRNGGWGLGLSICSQIATLMGGEVGVTSELGRGSTFYFDIPVALVVEDGKPAETREDGIADPGMTKILIAEDNVPNQQVLSQILDALGHQSVVVSNGFEAVNAVQEQPFDMVLMDIRMPGLDGVGAAEQIRNLTGPQRDIPIVAVTANAGVGARDQYLAKGMDDYLSKPINLGELAAVIARIKQSGDAEPS